MERMKNNSMGKQEMRKQHSVRREGKSAVEREIYQEKSRVLLMKGGIGFVIGFFIALFAGGKDFGISGIFLMGFFLAGVPYGWELLGKTLGQWIVIGSLPIMLIAYMLQIMGAILLGWIVYPIALFYNLMCAEKKREHDAESLFRSSDCICYVSDCHGYSHELWKIRKGLFAYFALFLYNKGTEYMLDARV